MQIINMHPGGVYTETISQILPKECYDWDSGTMRSLRGTKYAWLIFIILDTLPGNFAVWAATEQAAFLHGRYCWAGWDVEEMRKELGDKELANQQFLRVAVTGVEDVMVHK